MKYFLLALLLLVGCATKPIETRLYTCASIGRCGTYAHWSGRYPNSEAANVDALVIGKRLYSAGLVPTPEVFCAEEDEKENK